MRSACIIKFDWTLRWDLQLLCWYRSL